MTSLPTEIVLARRFGYGPAGMTPPSSAEALLDTLRGEDEMARRYPVPASSTVLGTGERYHQLRRKSKTDKSVGPEMKKARSEVVALLRGGIVGLLSRTLDSRTPFLERLTWFWADHFTATSRSGLTPALPASFVAEAIRPHVTGRFADMLKAAETHPAMIDFLDQTRSMGPDSPAGKKSGKGLNENLAREIMELHTVGAGGGYDQTDVVEFAELLTGLTFNRNEGTVFRAKWAEPGAETVLGQSYGGGRAGMDDIHAALEDLAARPETARHLARKLAVHFISDSPPDDLVDRMAEAYGSEGNLPEVYAALLSHPAAVSPDLVKIRQPLDFIAAGMRSLGVDGAALTGGGTKLLRATVLSPLDLMGQSFLSAPGPDGWPEEGERWLSPQGVAQRIFWGLRSPQLFRPRLPEPAAFAATALGVVDSDVELAIRRAESRGEAIGLVMAAPAFNRR